MTACAVVGIVSLPGCGGRPTISADVLEAAIRLDLETTGERCVDPVPIPLEVAGAEERAGWPGARRAAVLLEQAGMVRAVAEPARAGAANLVKYEFSDAAQPYARPRDPEHDRLFTSLCYGRRSMAKLVRWEGPAKLGAYWTVRAFYTYELSDVAAWASAPAVQAYYDQIPDDVRGEGRQEIAAILTFTDGRWVVR